MSIAPTETDKDKMIKGALRLLTLTAKFRRLTDAELIEQVVEKVWGAKLNLGSEEDFLLDELMHRFEARCGIQRDDEGRIIPPPPCT